MATQSNIQWTDATWNPITGCDKVSPGCRLCYAEKTAEWLQRMGSPGYESGFRLSLHPERLRQPLSLKTPKRIFVNSMSDWLHPDVPREFILSMFDTMNTANQHVYQLLTKRGDRLAEVGPSLPWAPHIWCGVSVENDEPYNAAGATPTNRIDQLADCGAESLFLSLEPLIGRLPDLDGALSVYGIGWVIVGGESGQKDRVRPMDLAWVREILAMCREASVPCFVKQLGTAWAVANNAKDRKGGDPAEWPEDLRVREYPASMLAHLTRR